MTNGFVEMDFRNKYRRHSIRLRGYDYTRSGAYFITVSAHEKCPMFGSIHDGIMNANEHGKIIEESWYWLAGQYPYVKLDIFVVMPNHIHGILFIQRDQGRSRSAPTVKPLGNLIAAFKTVSTKRINQIRQSPGIPVWQRNYYEHIIRSEESLDKIRSYIINNPINWKNDSLYI